MQLQHLDLLGQPLSVGDHVLTKSHGSQNLNTLAVIKKITPKALKIEVPKTYTDWGQYDHVTRSYPNYKRVTSTVEMTRYTHNCIKISKDQVKIIKENSANYRNQLLATDSISFPFKLTNERNYNLAMSKLIHLTGWYSPYREDGEIEAKSLELQNQLISEYPEYSL